jgi:hypothetical protein
VALAARPDIDLLRLPISEPGRYYHRTRSIVVRAGLTLVEERRYLWHELVHADRGDELCHASEGSERRVDREAARRAMPLSSLLWAAPQVQTWAEFADLLKAPEDFLRLRWATAHPAERRRVAALSQV